MQSSITFHFSPSVISKSTHSATHGPKYHTFAFTPLPYPLILWVAERGSGITAPWIGGGEDMDAGSPTLWIGVARRWSQPAARMPIEGPPSWSSRGRWPSCGLDVNQGPAFMVVSGGSLAELWAVLPRRPGRRPGIHRR
jgi:hypothetical protein